LRKNKEIEDFCDSKKSGNALVPEKCGDRDRRKRCNRKLPEIASLPEPWQTERLDDLDGHHGYDDERQRFGHAVFDQFRAPLSKRPTLPAIC